MSIRVVDRDIRVLQQRTRMPFRYGIATMNEFPLLFLSLAVEIDGEIVWGVASDLLPPKWFTKIPEKDPSVEIEEMLEVIENAVALAIGDRYPSVFDLWRSVYSRQESFAAMRELPSLLAHFGTSLVERAVIDAFARQRGKSFASLLKSDCLGIDLGLVHEELDGYQAADLLPAEPLATVIARHTIGLGDPLTLRDIPEGEQVKDGLPQALDECVRRYDLRHFKIKISGDLGVDLPRLGSMVELIEDSVARGLAYTLDGNEQFLSIDEFHDYWEGLTSAAWFESFFEKLLFVEQPLHRDVALSSQISDVVPSKMPWPRFIIDESDARLDSLPQALELGYHGTSHKNCKGVFKGIANRCLIEKRQRENPGSGVLMSGEDLCNQGPVGLLQDLAVMASLGIESVERNGHHYCRGLSGIGGEPQELVFRNHSDLYERTAEEWLTLRIRNGSLSMESINKAPFGYAFELSKESYPTLAQWRQKHQASTR